MCYIHCMTHTQATATRVVGYIRVSTDAQADRGVSLDAQRAKLGAYCTAMDLDLVAVVADEGLSAKSLDRPGLASALAMLRDGRADAVLVVKLDRLTRSVRDLGALVENYFANGRWSLLSVADSIDTRTAAGRLVLNVLASVAQWEREATAERTVDALAHLRAEGVTLGGAALGWKRTDAQDDHGRRVVVQVCTEAETVTRILALRASGATFRAIVETMTTEGRTTKLGGRWHIRTVQRVCERAR